MKKQFVGVECKIYPNGACQPTKIIWKDGRVFQIERVLHSCQSATHDFEGIRYTVLIGSAEKYLYQTGSRWYVEPAP